MDIAKKSSKRLTGLCLILLGAFALGINAADPVAVQKNRQKRLTVTERKELLAKIQNREVTNSDLLKRRTDGASVKVERSTNRFSERINKALK